jgi:hypothetical protein
MKRNCRSGVLKDDVEYEFAPFQPHCAVGWGVLPWAPPFIRYALMFIAFSLKAC